LFFLSIHTANKYEYVIYKLEIISIRVYNPYINAAISIFSSWSNFTFLMDAFIPSSVFIVLLMLLLILVERKADVSLNACTHIVFAVNIEFIKF
jgi:hypothetical protein